MTKSVFLAVLVFILTIAVAYLDEPLSADARALLATVPDRTTNRVALYRAGLGAPEGVDPLLYGRYVLSGVQARSPSKGPRQIHTADLFPLRSPRGALFCSLLEDAKCWSTIGSMKAEALTALEADNATLLNRYQTWLGMSDPDKPISRSPEEALPIEHLSGAHRLTVLRAFQDATHGRAEAAASRLRGGIESLRRHLALGDDFSAKLLLADLIDESLQALSVISHQHRLKGPALPALTASERDLSPAIARQFKQTYEFFLAVESLPAPNDVRLRESLVPLPGLYRFVYKSNNAINRAHQDMAFWIEAAQLTPANFANLMGRGAPVRPWRRIFDHLRNPVGQALGQLVESDFKPQIVRLQQLDIGIAMFNVTQTRRLDQIQSETIANPYGEALPASLSANQTSLCMPAPEVIEAKAVCLRLTA